MFSHVGTLTITFLAITLAVKPPTPERLHTTRENTSIIEYRAYDNLRGVKATLAALEQLSESEELIGRCLFLRVFQLVKKQGRTRSHIPHEQGRISPTSKLLQRVDINSIT